MNEDEIPAAELNAVAVFPHGNVYAFALMDRDGNLTAYHLSQGKLQQVFMVIGEALQPGLLASLGFNTAP
ncbi:hypothetical protein [Mycolicibacterium nivoides]|uniref:Uncharacterized protein n=1 Tax=Mycolicibacterium nivoides TaxID=2487344 RepID=A0ABW9L885_9MYCO